MFPVFLFHYTLQLNKLYIYIIYIYTPKIDSVNIHFWNLTGEFGIRKLMEIAFGGLGLHIGLAMVAWQIVNLENCGVHRTMTGTSSRQSL